MKREQLLAECERRGLVRYEHLTVPELERLVVRGYHYITPRRMYRRTLVPGRGVDPDHFDGTRHGYSFRQCADGYVVRGIDLAGRCGSLFVKRYMEHFCPMNSDVYKVTRMVFEDDDEGGPAEEGPDDGGGPDLYTVSIVSGGWFVPASRFHEFVQLIRAIDKVPPRSLQELAANVVTSRQIHPSMMYATLRLLAQQ